MGCRKPAVDDAVGGIVISSKRLFYAFSEHSLPRAVRRRIGIGRRSRKSAELEGLAEHFVQIATLRVSAERCSAG